ncbi:hypothetical protein AAMO2058_000436900 [Amorphochlora amoebiformis]
MKYLQTPQNLSQDTRKLPTEESDEPDPVFQIAGLKKGVLSGRWYDLRYCMREEKTGNFSVQLADCQENSKLGISNKIRTNVSPLQIRRKPSKLKRQGLNDNETAAWRRKNHIILSDENPIFNPYTTFNQLNLPKNLRGAVENFVLPMPIQAQSWPVLMKGRNIIGVAETGSGKTLAFLLPIIMKILEMPVLGTNLVTRGPLAVLLAPTRELTAQTFQVAQSIGEKCGLICNILFGGVNKHRQTKRLRNGTHIIVTSPGRLLEVQRERKLSLSRARFMVLDEADRMLDLGYKEDILNITALLPAERQMMMFSATWPDEVAAFGHQVLKNPVTVMVGIRENVPLACPNILQIVEIISTHPTVRYMRLKELLRKYHDPYPHSRVLIFVREQHKVKNLDKRLREEGYPYSQCVHAGKTQRERLKSIRIFSKREHSILVATDVAARGLDIPNIAMVINFALPFRIEDYVHRIGRTGRAGAKGLAYTFFGRDDHRMMGKLKKVLIQSGAPVPLDLRKMRPRDYDRQTEAVKMDYFNYENR